MRIHSSSISRRTFRLEIETLESRDVPATLVDPAVEAPQEAPHIPADTLTGTPNQRYVLGLYDTVLHRTPGPGEADGWVNALDTGHPRDEVASGVWRSAEHRGQQVDSYYLALLHRPADAAGRANWVQVFQLGFTENDVVQQFVISQEYTAAHPTNASYIDGLYNDLLGRPADPSSIPYWLNFIGERGATARAETAHEFLDSVEYAGKTVDAAYLQILERPADPVGRASWVSNLRNHSVDNSELAEHFLVSPEYVALVNG